MKKRLICLLLCIATVLSLALASCSKKDDEEATENITQEASDSAITLSMWVVSENEISDATAAAVTKALNTITESKFKIRLAMNFYTEDEYRSELEKTILAYEAAKKQQGAIVTEAVTEAESGAESAPVTDETETNEFGMSVIKYPELLANQVDIVYIAGEDMYFDFIDKGWLAELDTELSSSSKKIKEYVSATLLSAVKTNGTTYAVPNNCVIGEYTYMLLNKKLVEKYQQTGYVQYGQIDGFYNEYLYTFLNTVYSLEANAVPIEGSYEECLELLAHYWSIDPVTFDRVEEFSVFGSHYKDLESLSRGSVVLGYQSLFEDAEFTEAFLQLNKFKYGTELKPGTNEYRSYFGESSATTPAAVKFLTASSTALTYNETAKAYEYVDENGEAYYPIVVKYPTASSEDIYGNMFGVCQYSRNISRSMEIITYLNTNSDFRNILQYGVEKKSGNDNDHVHYEVVEDSNGNKMVHRLNQDYMMNIYATGNVFMAYPDPELDMTADVWESGKVQNRDSLVEPMLGMDFAAFSATTGAEEEAVKIPNNPGYVLSYTSGYSKDLFNQNATLKAWLESCDAAGKGIYILPTELIDGQNRTIYYYVYNNNGDADFSVDVLRETEIKTDNKGKETEVQTNLDFTMTYANSKSSGYELSLVQLYTKKTNDFELLGSIDGATSAVTIAGSKDLLEFDFCNTEEYTIDYYEALPKTAFSKNEPIIGWLLNDCGSSGAYVLKSVTEDGEQKIYNFAILYAGLKLVTDTQMITTGDAGELTVNLAFTDNADSKLADDEAKYLLHYVRVVADKDVDVNDIALTLNGKKLNYTAKEGECDFTLLGALDTELVKYLYQLNSEIVAAMDACTTYAEMEQLVDALTVLLATKGSTPALTNDQKTALQSVLKDDQGADKYNLSTLATYLKAAVATETVVEKDEDGNPLPDSIFFDEDPYSYASPNTIYYKWLTANGYKPKEETTK